MLPGRRNLEGNPYTELLADELERPGCVVEDIVVLQPRLPDSERDRPQHMLSAARCLLPVYDIVHIHWPQAFAQERSFPVAILRSLCLVTMLTLQRFWGARIVWTVHDVAGMTSRRKRLTALLIRLVVLLAHGLVHLGRSSRRQLESRHPAASLKPVLRSRHACYGAVYEQTDQHTARAELRLEVGAPVAGFIGDVKPYKGLDQLLHACEAIEPTALTLLVAGAAVPASAEQAISGQVERVRSHGVRVVRIADRLSEADLARAIAACDVVVMPYRKAWNSGLATLALEHDRPLLCSDLPVFRELHDEVGPTWVTLYESSLTAAVLHAAVAARQNSRGDQTIMQRFRERRSLSAIAEETLDFYQSLRRQPADA